MNTKYTKFLKDIPGIFDKIEIIPGDDICPSGQAWRKPITVDFFCRGKVQHRHYTRRQYVTWINDSGYVEFSVNSNHWLMHRAIAEMVFGQTFYDNEEVNHKDGNKLNNRISNLECVSHDANVSHAMTNRLIIAFPVLDTVTGEIYPSVSSIDKHLQKYDGYAVGRLLYDGNINGHLMKIIVSESDFELYRDRLQKFKEIVVCHKDNTRSLVNFA